MIGPLLSPIPNSAWFAAGPRPADQAPPEGLPVPAIDAGWAGRAILTHLAGLAARQPQAIAIADGVRNLDFATLYASACRLGATLRAAEWPEGAVGVLLPNDARYLVATFGCLAAGRPCMLLGPAMPGPFLARVVADAALAGVVATLELAALLGGAVPVLDADAALAAATSAAPPTTPLKLAPGMPAFIVSTSGTTGAPKAVAIAQPAVLATCATRIRALRFGPHDRVAVLGPPATSASLVHRVCALMAGAGLVLLDPQHAGLGRTLAGLRDMRATVLHATPLMMTTLARLPTAEPAFAALRLIMIGGDALMHVDLARIRSSLPESCGIHYSLALTESSRVAYWTIPPGDARDPLRVGAGYIAEEVEVALLDDDGRPVAPGIPGELVVRTPTSAAGDWVAGRVVEARYPVDPADPSRRIYRTGDIARITADGVLVVLGRRDRMVKLGGQRIEPAAIELALRALPHVVDAAVVPLCSGVDVRLAGFVVPAATAPESTEAGDPFLLATRAALRQALPAVMVPALLRRIGALPLTQAGKRDDKALADFAGQGA